MVKMRTKQSPCRYQFSNQIPSFFCKFNADVQIMENSWRNCVPSSLVKLSDRMMKSVLQSNLIFLQRNETKLRRARLKRDTRDLRKITLLRVVSRRIRGYVDILKTSCLWERILDSATDHHATNTTTEYGTPMARDTFRDDQPTPHRTDCHLQNTTKMFRPDEINTEPLLSEQPKEMLKIGQGEIDKSVRVTLVGSASQLRRLRTE